MARYGLGAPEVQGIVERLLVPLYLETGSVSGTTKALNEALQGKGVGVLHANRVHAALSDDASRALNQQSFDALRLALGALGPSRVEKRSEDRARLADAAARARAANGGGPLDMAVLAEKLSMPPAVLRLALASSGDAQDLEVLPSGHHRAGPDWSFQDKAVARCLDAIHRRPNGNIGLVLPTGAGKTRTAFRIILQTLASESSKTTRALWITHRRSLHAQAHRELMKLVSGDAASLPPDALALSARVQFVMIGEAAAELEAGSDLALVVVDEAHHAAAATYQPIFEAKHSFPVLLLTATPNRPDLLPIGIDEIAFTITYRELAERGVIITPSFEPFEVPDFTLSGETMGNLVDMLVAESGDRFKKTMVLVTRIEQMRELHERLATAIEACPGHPLRSADVGFVGGGHNSHGLDTEDFLALFGAKPQAIVISAQMLLEGYDDPQIDAVVITYKTDSVIKLMQAAGRCVRYAPGKTRAWVIQASNPDLAYRFDQRWLYQEIDDRLLPQLRDLDFADTGEMLSVAADLLSAHNVDSRSRSEAMAAIAACTPDDPARLMFYGLPFFGKAEEFDEKAQWGVFVETPQNTAVFRAVFNRFSELGAQRSDPTEFLDVLGPGLGLAATDQKLRRQLMGVLTAAYFAHEELTRAPGAAQGNRGYARNHSTTWLQYVTMRYRPVLPDVLSSFVSDCHNRGALERAYTAQPSAYAMAIKTPMPFGGSEGLLLSADAWGELEAWLGATRDELRVIEPAAQLAQLEAIRAGLTAPRVPMTHLLRADRLLSDDGRSQFSLALPGATERTNA